MRNIPFRVWDNLQKVYLNGADLAIDSTGNVFILEGYDHNDSDLWYARLLVDPDNERYVIEPSTGLKDKNGTEIYKGDILKYQFPYDRRFRHISPVSYLDTQAGFGIVDTYDSNIPLYAITATNYFEVIGNIHENSELLEEK